MDRLIELKTKIISFVEKYETFVKPASKLVMLVMAYLMIYARLGFFGKLHIIFIPIILAVVCAILPSSLGILMLAAYTLINLYGLGVEVTAVAFILFFLCYLLYFRFAPKKGYLFVMTPVASFLRVPYALPVGTGLAYNPLESLPIIFGMMVYYFLKAVSENETLFRGGGGSDELTQRVTATVNLFLGNKEMWIVVLAFMFVNILVYIIRRLGIKNSWKIAIYVGITTELLIILAGKLLTGNSEGLIGLFVGTVISLGLCILEEFFLFNLDYTRVERVQFEDDQYYYYVTAIPKTIVKAKDKKITTFKQQTVREKKEAMDEESQKEMMAKELEIDPTLLK